MEYVHQPSLEDPTSYRITSNMKIYLFFKDAVGAIDGSHIPARPLAEFRTSFQNRKGRVSQNCLFTCSFDFLFTYTLTGWEGSASDARVYEDTHLC